MSLGKRTYYRSIILANCHITNPREPFLFLHPHRFKSSAVQAPPAIPESRAHNLDDLSIPSDQVDRINQAVIISHDHVIPPNSTSQILSEGFQTKKTSPRPLKSDQQRIDEAKRDFREISSLDSKGDTNRFRLQTLAEALASLTKQSLQDRFESSNVTSQRRNSIPRREIKALRVEKNLSSRSHGDSPWSFDWSAALRALKTRFPHPDGDPKMGIPPTIMKSLEEVTSQRNPQKDTRTGYTRYFQVRAQDIPCPLLWSCPSLMKYVTELTESKVSRQMNRYLYGDDRDHAIVVGKILENLFFSNFSQPFLTIEAFNIAINFFLRRGIQKITLVRKFFTLMEKLGMDTDPETFNIMLRGAASRKDLHNFTFLFRTMLRKGLKPNEDTWVALLTAVTSNVAKLRIVETMRERGILRHQRILQNVAEEIVPLDISDHVKGGQDVASFFREVDPVYGSQWLSIKTGNKMCQELGEHGLMREAIEVLDIMVMRGCHPTNITLNIFLGQCKRKQDLEGAIYMLHWFDTISRSISKTIPYDTVTYDILFTLAWGSLHFNCCRVLWCMACIDAAVSYKMQRLVLKSLFRNTPDEPQCLSQMWMKSVGKVASGVDISIKGESDRANAGKAVFNRLIGYAPKGAQRATQRQLASLLLAKDLESVKHYSYKGKFVQLLVKTLELDKAWRTNGKQWSESTLWRIQNTVDIDLEGEGDEPTWRPINT